MGRHQRLKTLNLTMAVAVVVVVMVSIIMVIMLGALYATSIDATNSVHPFNGSDDTGKANGNGNGNGNDNAREEFVLSINISENTWYGKDKDISVNSYRTSFGSAPSRTTASDTRHPLLPALKNPGDNGDGVDFHHDINKSNQGSTNSHNRPSSPIHGEGELNADSSETSTDSALSSAYFEHVELQESHTPARKGKLLLHRHKRYLLFPEGSSFQLVFDLIIPIVDYTNFAIMGITCAVAWELPSKPPSEIIENFRTRLNDGTFGTVRRNDSVQQQLQYLTDDGVDGSSGSNRRQGLEQLSATVNTAATTATATSAQNTFMTNARRPPPRNFYYSNFQRNSQVPGEQMASHPYYQPPKQDNFLGSPDKGYEGETFHAGTNGWSMQANSHKWSLPNSYQTKASSAPPAPFPSWAKENWWERNKDRIEKQWYHNQQNWQSYGRSSQRMGRNRKILTKKPKHRIYSVFGRRRKRSHPTQFPQHTDTVINNDDGAATGHFDKVDDGHDDDLANKLHEIHTKEHLYTRHKLYGKIEKLYRTRGHNGTACVLRTLCETHKDRKRHHSHNTTPRTFVMELLRAIFTLPQDTLATLKHSSPTSSFIGSHYTDAALHAHTTPTCSQLYDGCERPIWQGVDF